MGKGESMALPARLRKSLANPGVLIYPSCSLVIGLFQELEDTFDKDHKLKLSRVIFRRTRDGVADTKKPTAFRLVPLPDCEEDEPSVLGLDDDVGVLSMRRRVKHDHEVVGHSDEEEDDDALYIRGGGGGIDANHHDLVELKRIPTLAVFHKTTDGKGTPHAFSVFMRQFPALPRVVVS
jgi:KUP system potassium uptake protein